MKINYIFILFLLICLNSVNANEFKVQYPAGTDIFNVTNVGNAFLENNLTATDVIIPAMTGNDGMFSVNHFFKDMTSAGRLTGGEIVASTGINIIVTEGTGLLRDLDDDHSQVRHYIWDNSSAIEVANDSIMYFGIDLNGGSPIVVNFTTDDNFDLDTSFPLGTVINQDGNLYIMNNPWWVGDGLTNIIERFQAEGWLERDDNRGGLTLGYNDTRHPTMSAGTLWSRLTEHEFPEFTAPTNNFSYFYRDGAGGYTQIEEQTQWNVSHYDDNSGTLQPITKGDFAVIWVWANVGALDIALMYPQQIYNKAAQAEAEDVPNTFPAMWYKGGVIIGRIIIEEGVDAPTEVQTAFTTQFTASLAADHGNLAGLADDDHLQYLRHDGTRTGTGNWDQGSYNLTNVDSWFLGKTTWAQIQDKFITAVDDIYINMAGTTATFNQTINNETMDARDDDTTYTNSSFDLSQIPNTDNVDIGAYNVEIDSGNKYCLDGNTCNSYVNATAFVSVLGGHTMSMKNNGSHTVII